MDKNILLDIYNDMAGKMKNICRDFCSKDNYYIGGLDIANDSYSFEIKIPCINTINHISVPGNFRFKLQDGILFYNFRGYFVNEGTYDYRDIEAFLNQHQHDMDISWAISENSSSILSMHIHLMRYEHDDMGGELVIENAIPGIDDEFSKMFEIKIEDFMITFALNYGSCFSGYASYLKYLSARYGMSETGNETGPQSGPGDRVILM